MPVPSKMSDLFTLAASNSPAGSDLIGNSLDDYLRSHAAIIRSTNALASASIASASTTDLSTSDGEQVTITGTATINSLGTVPSGIVRELSFQGACTLVNSSAIVLPFGSSITTAAGDIYTFRSLGAGNWVLTSSTKSPGYLALSGGTMIGALVVAPSASNATVTLNRPTSTQLNYFVGQTAGVNYWGIAPGAATTSNFLIDRYSNTGVYVDTPVTIAFGTGQVTFANQINGTNCSMSGAVSGATVTATGNVTSGQNFISSTANAVVAPNPSGTVYLRPNGAASSVGQVNVGTNGFLNVSAGTNPNPTASASLSLNLSGNYGGGLHLQDGTNDIAFWSTSGNLNVGFSTSGGALTSKSQLSTGGVWTATDFTATSDRRLKKMVRAKPVNDRLADMLELCTWLWKKSNAPGHGVIAQRVREIAPEYVHEGENGYLSVDKAGLALECVIGLAARVRELEAS